MSLATRAPIQTLILLIGLSTPALGQASYSETFDDLGEVSWSTPGPQVLINRGWQFRNQSQPLGSHAYFTGATPSTNPIYFNPQSGAGYLAVDGGCTDTVSGGQMSAWAILPPVSNQVAGDAVTIWLRSLPPNERTLEVRYSSSGGTNTGSGSAAVGDFTQVLINANPVPSSGWTRYQARVPGGGRLALRFTGYQPGLGNYTAYLGMDSLSVGVPLPPPCNLPPIPAQGQTVTWTAANSPYRVCENISIPPGATVNVEPGVTVNIDSGRQLSIAGTLNLLGTAASRIRFIGATNFPPMVDVTNGTIVSTATDFQNGQVRINSGATIQLTSSSVSGSNSAFIAQELPALTPFIHLVGCTFTNTIFTLSDALTILENNTFINTNPWLLRGYTDITAPNTVTGGFMEIDRERSIQPLLVDGVHISGSPGPALRLSEGMYRIGPNTSLTGNQYPLRVEGGLTNDSSIPLSGNTNNAIDVGNGGFRGEGTWPNLGLTYRLTEPGTSLPGGNLVVQPGVIVEAAHPDAWMVFRSTRFSRLLGEPDSPVTFRGLGGQLWNGMTFATNATTGGRLDHCVIQNGEIGVGSVDNWLFVDNCLIQNNQVGANANTYGVISFAKTRFTGNNIGISYTDLGSPLVRNDTNPNSIAGNTVGVNAFEAQSSFEDFRNTWWGSPTGPTIASNPGGAGDSITGAGASSVQYSPFLTSPPTANIPPVIRLNAPGLNHVSVTPDTANPDFLLEPGTKLILRWNLSSDDAIVSQRIEFSPDGPYPDRYFVIAGEIPPSARSWEITIPSPGFAGTYSGQFLKVVATDAAGQAGFDHIPVSVPDGNLTGDLVITTSPTGQTFIGGQDIPRLRWTGGVNNFPTLIPMVVLESDGDTIMGINVSGEQGMFFEKFPLISTDRARFALMARTNSNNIAWFFAPGYFSIRHDPRLGFTPPTVALSAPTQGQSFPGGSSIPISWTASAAEGLRSFDIQASSDNGRSWHLVARDLPSATRSYTWQLPPSTGIPSAMLRVIARDQRFQNSSTSDITISITPGSGPSCYANCDNSTGAPLLTANDFQCFINKYAAGDPYANCDASTGTPALTANDFQCFINRYAGGCQ